MYRPAVVILDTSVLTNILNVPGKNQHRRTVMRELHQKIERGDTLVLTAGSIIETGNHIANSSDGRLRRECAEALKSMVSEGLGGDMPWTVSSELTHKEISEILDHFSDEASAGVGIVDISIRREWERQCELNPARRVEIWSMDADLKGYSRFPTL